MALFFFFNLFLVLLSLQIQRYALLMPFFSSLGWAITALDRRSLSRSAVVPHLPLLQTRFRRLLCWKTPLQSPMRRRFRHPSHRCLNSFPTWTGLSLRSFESCGTHPEGISGENSRMSIDDYAPIPFHWLESAQQKIYMQTSLFDLKKT